MALTYSPKIELGEKLKSFSLPNVVGGNFSTEDLNDNEVLCVLFICNHCPYVKAIEDRLIALGKHFQNTDVKMVAICSNDPSEYPEDSPEQLKARALEKSYPFPYLFDSTQQVAKNFGAVCTPDIFVFDRSQNLFYRGRLDDSWRDPAKVSREELKEALELALKNKTSPETQNPSMGCSIKWVN